MIQKSALNEAICTNLGYILFLSLYYVALYIVTSLVSCVLSRFVVILACEEEPGNITKQFISIEYFFFFFLVSVPSFIVLPFSVPSFLRLFKALREKKIGGCAFFQHINTNGRITFAFFTLIYTREKKRVRYFAINTTLFPTVVLLTGLHIGETPRV